jgi:hypothetical protein
MFIPSSESPWSGRPTPEIDDSWGKLLDNASICVSDDELLKLNETSIDLQERRGKLAWLEVSHQIHCVVGLCIARACIGLNAVQQYVRKAIYRSYYYPEITDQDWEDFMQPHIGILGKLDSCLWCRLTRSRALLKRSSADRNVPWGFDTEVI